jgi:hypothetical protein
MKISLVTSAIITLLLLGTLSLITSLGYNSSILAFIGIGLVFWGAILLYIKPEQHIRETLQEAVLSPSLTTLNQIIQELGYKGDAIYLPPKYFTNPETTKIYISKNKNASLPTPELIQLYENQPLTRTAQGLLIPPPGIQLSKLMEEVLGTTFIKTDFKNLQQKLPKLFIEDLEIAEDLEMQEENNPIDIKQNPVSDTEIKNTTIHAKITKPFYRDTFKDAEDPSQTTSSIGDPVCSAIAIALAKATGKPVRITNTKSIENRDMIEVTYTIIEDQTQ